MPDQHSKHCTSGLEILLRHNPYTASAGLTPEVIDAAMRRAHVERARAAASLTAAIWRGLRTGVQAMARGIARAQRRRAAHLMLRYLDPHLRDDIGLGEDRARLVEDTLTSPPGGGRASGRTRAEAIAASDTQHRRAA